MSWEIGSYNPKHSVGTAYKVREIKARRDQIYDKYTRHLIPPIHFYPDQQIMNTTRSHKLPFIGFRLQHLGDSLPVNVRVEAKVVLDKEDKGLVEGTKGYYNGEVRWNINPRTIFFGGFSIKPEYAESDKELMIEFRVTVIDQYEREHTLLPQCWRYIKKIISGILNLGLSQTEIRRHSQILLKMILVDRKTQNQLSLRSMVSCPFLSIQRLSSTYMGE